ncbi:hypothetical protein GJ496_009331 [Pomphorhynchus laevis]|nr:hypothetical protein GJ496_009331 [Pomphorhynchus laevis]
MNGRQNEQPRPVTLQPFCGDVFNHPSMTAPVFFLNPMNIDRSQCNTSIPQLYNLPQHILPIQPLSFQQNFIYPSHIRHQYATQSFRGAMTPEMIQNLPRSIASSTAPAEPIVKRKPHPLPVINPSSGQEVRLRPPILPGKPLYHSEYRGNSSVLINTDVRRSNVSTSTSSSTAAADKEVANYTDLAAIPKNNTKPVVKKVFTRNLATEKEFTHEKKQKKSNPLLDKTEKNSLVQEDDSGDMLYCLIKKIRDGEHVVFTENIKHIDSTKKYVPKSGINIATSQELAQSSNVIDDDLPPEIRDLINPEMKITNAFDRSEPVQEEIQEWLPSEMQMSDDDDKIDEYLADINEISDELQNVDAKDSNVEDINKENTIVTES